MSYFPDSLLPATKKQESNDILGNKFIINASDYNKLNTEIRAIEMTLGARKLSCPCDSNSQSGNLPCDTGVTNDIVTTLVNLITLLQKIRDDSIFLTSGTVCLYNKGNSLGPLAGLISFPSDWPITYLVNELQDGRSDDDFPLNNPDYIELGDVSNMPEEGYISIINDVSSMICTTYHDYTIRIPGFTSLVTSGTNIYQNKDIDARTNYNLNARVFGLGTNIEIIYYSGIDVSTKRIYNIKRMSLGTSATRHANPDLVFKGKLSIGISPQLATFNNSKSFNAMEVVLRSDGRIEMETRTWTTSDEEGVLPDFTAQTQYAYAQYNALLIRNIDPITKYIPPTSEDYQKGCA